MPNLSPRPTIAGCTVLTALLLSTPLAASAFQVGTPMRMDTNITEAQVLQAQQAWCAGLLSISQAYASGGLTKAKALASQVLDQAYGYQYGPVAFKPTLTIAPQTFRPTKAGALAYFVGGDPSFPNDKGFAIKPWKSCVVRNQVIQLHGMFATTMGNVDLTNDKGVVTTVDKTWTFIREPDGSVRIVLHHSSLPFTNGK
ncbi:MAG: phosphoribosyl-AMP cyclohydrolase [Cyanobacteriota bacterium]|nr:phosphoribosyl-AMP cyclohydrolase [Cyanobacteriota bacterium]